MSEDKLIDVKSWFEYFPNELIIDKYTANQIMSLEKIKDVYHSLTYGRLCVDNLFVENYGDLIDEDENGLGRIVIKSTIMNNCLSYYNYCIDYSWQVLWLYYNTVDKSYFNSMDKYIEFMEKCNLKKLKKLLIDKEEKQLCKHIEAFFNNNKVKTIRKKYNTIKHRGFYHIEGLGENYKESIISIDGKRLPLLHREELDLNKLKEELIEFDNLFVKYFEVIIDKVVPSEIKDGSCREMTLEDVIARRNDLLKLLENEKLNSKK